MYRLLALAWILALAAPLAGVDAADKIYQWKDRNGVTHYTDRPPAEGDYEDRDIVQNSATPPANAAARTAEDTLAVDNADQLAAQREENCRRAEQNLETLRRSTRVQLDRDGDGTPETLSDAERTHQMEVAAQQMRRYCGG